jgi:hypothetical protein
MTRATDAVENRRATARKLVGTVAVLGSAAAISGLATFGNFTDSTAPVATGVDTGVVSISLNTAAEQAVVPYQTGGLLPGDYSTLALDLVNDGTSALSSVTLTSVATQSSALNTDAVNGLQLSLQSCSDAWRVVGRDIFCAGTVTDHYAGPVVVNRALTTSASLAPGGVDHLAAKVSFPAGASNAYQNAVSSLSFTFTGVQRTGGAR